MLILSVVGHEDVVFFIPYPLFGVYRTSSFMCHLANYCLSNATVSDHLLESPVSCIVRETTDHKQRALLLQTEGGLPSIAPLRKTAVVKLALNLSPRRVAGTKELARRIYSSVIHRVLWSGRV